MIYLDSAAVVKLAHAESKPEALRDWLAERADIGWLSSVLAEVESFRALARYSPEAITRLHPVLDLIELVDLDLRIRALAQSMTCSSHPDDVLGSRQALSSAPELEPGFDVLHPPA